MSGMYSRNLPNGDLHLIYDFKLSSVDIEDFRFIIFALSHLGREQMWRLKVDLIQITPDLHPGLPLVNPFSGGINSSTLSSSSRSVILRLVGSLTDGSGSGNVNSWTSIFKWMISGISMYNIQIINCLNNVTYDYWSM